MITNSFISSSKLIEILKKMRKPNILQYIIIDIDDTIMDTTKRKEKIYKELKIFYDLPDLSPIELKKSYNIIDLLKNKKIDKDLLLKVNKTFFKYFLSNEYLGNDRQFPGVSKFIKNILEIGFHVIYLTGRHLDMLKGTIESFRSNNIPINDRYIELIMKNDLYQPDIVFKMNFIDKFDKKDDIICIIDNDSETCNELRKIMNSNTLIVQFNSTQKDSIEYCGFHLDKWN
jgi:hypothetical protein